VNKGTTGAHKNRVGGGAIYWPDSPSKIIDGDEDEDWRKLSSKKKGFKRGVSKATVFIVRGPQEMGESVSATSDKMSNVQEKLSNFGLGKGVLGRARAAEPFWEKYAERRGDGDVRRRTIEGASLT